MPPVGTDVAQIRRARRAVAALFLTNGALFANLAPRLPEIKADLALSNTSYGIVVAAFPAGALTAGLAAGALIRRFTSARLAVVCTAGIALLTLAAAFSPTAVLVALALFAGGACDAVVDVAQNTQGLRVQRAHGRSIINSLHGIWSLGAVLGSAMAAGAIALNVPREAHIGVTGVLFTVVALTAYRFLVHGPDAVEHAHETAARRANGVGLRVYVMLTLLVVIAIAGAVVEDAGSSWATLYLGDDLGAGGAVAVLGYIALLSFQFIGRMTGDRLVDRFGERAVVRTGGLITAVGMGAALLFPSVPDDNRRFRGGRDRHRYGDPGGHARRGPNTRPARGQRSDRGGVAHAVGFRRGSARGRRRRRCHQSADRSPRGARGRARRRRRGWGPQWTTPAISIVRTPATIRPMPMIILNVSGSPNTYLARTATSATPHAVQMP